MSMSAVQKPWRWRTGSQRTRSAGIVSLAHRGVEQRRGAGNFTFSSAMGLARLRISASAVSYGTKNFGR